MLPTRNSKRHLESHLHSLSKWLDLAQQVVVVDSLSEDGTLDYLKANLRHPNVQFLTHPPGLYQSWNFGIGRLQTEFTYISTVGDTITRTGIEHLVKTIAQLHTDVLMSPPAFWDEQGRQQFNQEWPIHELIADLKIKAPQSIEKGTLFFFAAWHAIVNCLRGILGSSASNVYRTQPLQTRPFPLDFGHAGDTGWGLLNSLEISFAVTPEVCSTFLLHELNYQVERELNFKRRDLLAERAAALLEGVLARDKVFRASPQAAFLQDMLFESRAYTKHVTLLRQKRSRRWLPWIFDPTAWVSRQQKRTHWKRLQRVKQQYLDLLRTGAQS